MINLDYISKENLKEYLIEYGYDQVYPKCWNNKPQYWVKL